MQTDNVIFKVLPGKGGDIGKIILNRPQFLNALNVEMCIAIRKKLLEWAEEDSIKAVIISAVGERAFCAGGDIQAIYKICCDEKNHAKALNFFQNEYAMNELIFNFPKPYLAFLDGLTMGGGVGVGIHGSHPIATERLTLAMPETGIGFFPDVGVGYHLARLPNCVGDYLGLTGEKIGPRDAYRLDLVKAIVPSERLLSLETALIETFFANDDFFAVTEIIAPFHFDPNLVIDLDVINIGKTFAYDSVEEIILTLNQFSQPWSLVTAEILQSKSPLSLKVTFEHLRHCRELDFTQTMAENLNLTRQFINSHDFMEGIRAAVIDKDRHPIWKPNKLKDIRPEMLRAFFPE